MTKTTFNAGFGKLARDANGTGAALQTATAFVTVDAASSPITSPMVYSGTTVYALTVPDPAVQLVLAPSTDLRVSEDPAIAHYDVVPAGTKEAFAVALMQTVYVRRDTADGSLRFRFVKV